LIFVTNDIAGFYDSAKTGLAESLVEEVSALPIAFEVALSLGHALKRLESFPAVANAEASRLLEAERVERGLGVPLAEFLQPSIISASEELVGDEFDTSVEDYGSGSFDLSLPPELETATLYNIDLDLSTLTVDVYDTYDETTVLATATVHGEATFDGFVYKADYYANDPDVEVWDSDWNDHYVWAATHRQLELVFNVTADVAGETVDEVTLEAIRELPQPRPTTVRQVPS